MLKIHTNTSMTMVPTKVLQDTTLSLEAKALYLIMWSQENVKDFSLDELHNQTKSSVETIQQAYDELVNVGYVTTRKADLHLWMIPQKVVAEQPSVDETSSIITAETVVQDSVPFETTADVKPKPKKLNKWEQIEQLIENYTDDRDLRKALKSYFLCRMNPAPTSRFSMGGSVQVYQVQRMLQQLDGLTGDKVKIVDYCKENEYMKFFDLPKPKSFDGVKSESITVEEMDAIHKRWAELEAQGKRVEY